MRKIKPIIISILVFFAIAIFLFFSQQPPKVNGQLQKEINPYLGDIKVTLTTTGVIQPQNRLEIKPSINGRIEAINVNEGDQVKKGDVLAYMSSIERAALIDAASAKDETTRKYWQDVYKQTPIISPIDGQVIVRAVEPGQTVTTATAVLVLSDHLIVSAQFDETDIGIIKVEQPAVITLDAYPKVKIEGKVDHIAYESRLISNVNIYDVDILPQNLPDFFRSGMSANVEVIEKEKKNVLLIPQEAIIREKTDTFVLVKNGVKIEKRNIEIGLTDEKNTEVVFGLTLNDKVFVQNKDYLAQKKQTGTNPFMPFRNRKK